MQSRAEHGRTFINTLRVERGGLSRAERKQWQAAMPDALVAIDYFRRTLGATTKTLAHNLYAANTRFVYELIQNAEDNQYNLADTRNEVPWLRFSLTSETITIDSNEDGFTEANVRAICTIAESTKSSTSGFIGEKGIGFKSVFKVAKKVHVQSEPYSFSFRYQRDDTDDNGLGMVTPFNEDPLALPSGTSTRIVLHLLDGQDRTSLYKDFVKLPDTLLMFLTKLRCLEIDLDIPEQPKLCLKHQISSPGNRAEITTTKNSSTKVQTFLTTRRQVSHMPKDNARKNVSNAEVVLAFPLDGDMMPIIKNQYTFAFLPLKKLGFKFLIQSDFITQASREDVFDNAWNHRLLDEVSKAFVQSIEMFLRDPSLQHKWVRYLPTDTIADDFWGGLKEKILRDVCSQRAFFQRRHASADPLKASRLKIASDVYKDEFGKPLLRDRDAIPTKYISKKYDEDQDLPCIRQVGATSFTTEDFRLRLEYDLKSDHSCVKSKALNGPWHIKFAKVIYEATREPRNLHAFKALPFVPLHNGKWATALHNSIFLPTSGGVDVPLDLSLGLIHSDVLENKVQRLLFTRLGILECEPARIVPLINQRYRGRCDLGVADCFSHVNFLFWHHREDFVGQSPEIPIVASDAHLKMRRRNSDGWGYSPLSKSQDSFYKIFEGTVPAEIEDDVFIVNQGYYVSLKSLGKRNKKTGKEWLNGYWQIKDSVQLKHRHKDALSPEFHYVLEHIPNRLLGLLKASWAQFLPVSSFKDLIASAKVPVLDSDSSLPLKETYLPLPKLKTIVAQLGLESHFGFLKEIDGISDAVSVQWQFLSDLGVRYEEDLHFWKELYRKIRFKEVIGPEHVFEIYANLQKFMGQKNLVMFRDSLNEITDNCPIYIANCGAWVAIDECVWDAPAFFQFKHVLSRYETYERLYSLFISGLGVSKNTTVQHFLEALKDVQDSAAGSSDLVSSVHALYSEIRNSSSASDVKNLDLVREQFETHSLVYCSRTQSWSPPSACVWAEFTIKLPSKTSIATEYNGLKGFFTSILRIRAPILEDHVAALITKASKDPDKHEVLNEMQNICALSPSPKSLRSLLDCECFPIRMQDGGMKWMSCNDEFAVVDRVDLENHFLGKIKLLHFSLEEVHDVARFIHALGLQKRYLSGLIRQATRVPEDTAIRHEALTERLRSRAFTIARYAIHSRASKNSIPNILTAMQHAEVYTSDSIENVLSVVQDEKTVTASAKAFVHIKPEDNSIKIFVPRRRRDRDICLGSQLPETLLKKFEAETIHASSLGQALNFSRLSSVVEFLELKGIINDARIENPDVTEEEEEEEEEDEDHSLSDNDNANSEDAAEPVYQVEARAASISRSGTSSTILVASLNEPNSVEISSAPNNALSLYRRLLDVVILQAEAMEGIPIHGQRMHASLSTPFLSHSASQAVQANAPLARDFNIGAAGELFVFEFLSGLELPDFGLHNWQSTIRDRVRVHEKYSDIASWPDPETADIVYHDEYSALTDMLAERGYLDPDVWKDCSPIYYIEVKTTMVRLETPFYVSHRQFERMEEMTLSEGEPSDEIYLIMRVFGMGSGRMGMQVFVDPATLRRNNILQFRSDKYEVTPRN